MMVSTFYNYQAGTPEQTSPYNGLVSRALKGYQQAQQAKYQPRLYEAEIMGKTLGPLAQFATSPAGNVWAGEQGDAARQAISQIIAQYQHAQQPQQGGWLSRLFGGGQPQGGGVQGGQQSDMQGGTYTPGQGSAPFRDINDVRNINKENTLNKFTESQLGNNTIYTDPSNIPKLSPGGKTKEEIEKYGTNKGRVNDLVSDFIKQTDKLIPDTWENLGKSMAAGVQGLKLPFGLSNIASQVLPAELHTAEAQLNKALIDTGLFDPEAAYKISHKQLLETIPHWQQRVKHEIENYQRQGERVTKTGREGGVPLSDEKAAGDNYVPPEQEAVSQKKVFVLPDGRHVEIENKYFDDFMNAYPKAKPYKG